MYCRLFLQWELESISNQINGQIMETGVCVGGQGNPSKKQESAVRWFKHNTGAWQGLVRGLTSVRCLPFK